MANKYLDLMNKEETVKVNTSMYAAGKSNPQQKAEVIDLAAKAKMPVDVVERNKEAVQQQVNHNKYLMLMEDSPKLKKWLSDPNNAAVARDNIESLTKVERAINQARGLTESLGRTFETFTKTLLVDPAIELTEGRARPIKSRLPLTDVGFNDPITGEFKQYAPGQSRPQNFQFVAQQDSIGKSINTAMRGIAQSLEISTQESFKSLPESIQQERQTPGLNVAKIIDNAGQIPAYAMALLLPGTGATKLLPSKLTQAEKAILAGAASNSAVIGSQTYTDAYNAAYESLIDTGTHPDEAAYKASQAAQKAASQIRAIASVTGAFGEGSALAAQGLKGIAKAGAKGAASEVPEELAQSAFAKAAGGEHLSEDEIGEIASLAAILGFGTNVTIATASNYLSAADQVEGNAEQNLAKSGAEQDALDAIAENIKPLAEQSPQAAKQLIEELAPDDNIYIPSPEATTLFQSLPESETSKIIAEQLLEATEFSDVVIPAKDFLAEVVPSDAFEEIRVHIRLSADSLSQAEMESGDTSQVQSLIKEAEQHAQIKDEADLIYSQVRDQLIGTGRLSSQAAGYSAQLVPAYVTTQAARTGKTAKDIYESLGLKIEGPERRKDPGKREILENLPPQEREIMLSSDVVPSLPGKRAFEMHRERLPDEPVMYLDLDDFKATNEKYGHDGADKILEAVGDIKKALGAETGVSPFHRSGDEFLATGSQEKLDQYAAELQKRLDNAIVTVETPDGKTVQHKGIGSSYGVGQDHKQAEGNAELQKEERKRLGLRTGRDTKPVPGEDTQGQQDNESGDLVLNQTASIEAVSDSSVDSLVSSIEDRYPVKALNLFETSNGDLQLNSIIVEKGQRRQGVGSDIMNEITAFADQNQKRLTLTPAIKDDFQGTTSKGRLIKFYKKFGFIENKGRNKDFAISGSMYRDPSSLGATPQTKTPEFKQWFGDSKVVDDNGEPLVVHHGGLDAGKITVFDDSYQGDTTGNNETGAFHFTDIKEVADDYGRQSFIRRYQDDPESLLMDGKITEEVDFNEVDAYEFVEELAEDNIETQSVFLQIENPIVIDMGGERVDIAQIEALNKFAKEGVDETGELFDQYYEQIFGEYDQSDIDNFKTEIEEKAREEFGLDENEEIEEYQFREATQMVMDENGYEVEQKKIDGIIIKNMVDDIGPESNQIADQFIVFKSEQIKSATHNRGTFDPNDPSILNQENQGQIEITDEASVIRMFESSNLSTFLHESGHLFLNLEAQFVGEKLTKDQKTILEWLDAESFDELLARPGEVMSDVKREKLEKWARGFEAYLFEGKAPSIELRNAFAKFRDWLLQIYRSVKNLNVELNDDIRQVFDRMLATDEQIAAAQNTLGHDLLFTDAQSAGMTKAEWKAYQEQQQKAKDRPRESLQQKILSQLRRKTEKWWKDEISSARIDIRDELSKEKVYQAVSFLKEPKTENKLNRDLVKEIIGLDAIPGKLRKTTVVNGGMNPDEVAVSLGYQNGHEMLTHIMENPTLEEAANAEAEARMVEKHGDILNDGTLEKEAIESAHDEERGKLLLQELRQLGKKVNRSAIDRETLKSEAKRVISQAKISDIRPDKYRRAEMKAALKAQTAFKEGNQQEAYLAKSQQAANFYLWKEATKAKEGAAKQREYLAKIKTKKYSAKEVNVEYTRVRRLLASVYDFRKGAKPESNKVLEIAKWIDEQINSEGAAPLQYIDQNLSKAIFAIQEAKNTNATPQITITNYDDMTVEELRGVYEQARHLLYVGKKLSENEKAKFNAKVEKIGNSIYDNGKKVVTVPEEETSRDKAMEYLRQFSSDHLALADHIEEMDGFKEFGPLFNEFYQKVIDSSDMELALKREAGDKLIAAFRPFITNIPLKSSELRAKSWLREGAGTKNVKLSTGDTWALSSRARIMLALYWGAPENHETITKGRGVTEAEVNEMLSYLTDKEMDLVEQIWEINESLWEPSKAVNMRLTGASAPRVETESYAIGDRTLPGGYMRLYYDKEVKDMVLRDVDTLEKMTRAGSGVTKNTAHGSRHARVGSGGRRVSLDLNNIYRALDEVIHDTSFAETAIETTAILNSKPVRDAISTRYGIEKYKSVQQSLSNVIAGHVAGNGGFLNALMRIPRQAATYTILGYSIRNLLQQPLALGPMVSQVGEKQMTKAVFKFYSNPAKWVKFVQENSEFMRNRTTLVNRDTAEAMNQVDSGVMSGAFKRHAFSLQTLGDAIVIYPGWLAAYENGLQKFANHKKAATYASEVAAKSVGSGLMKDMSPLLQGKAESAKGLGPEAIKLYTFMYSYFNTMSRLVRKSAVKNNLGTVKGAGQFSREMFWIVTAPALIGAWMTGEVLDDDESWMWWAIKTMGFFGMGMVVGLRDMASAMQGFKPTTATGRAMSSAMKIYQTTAKIAEGEADVFSPEVVARLVRAAGSITPVPGGSQLARTLDYVADDPSDPNIYDALVVGKKYD